MLRCCRHGLASRLAMLWLGLQLPLPQRLVLLLPAMPLLLPTLPTLPTLPIMLASAGAALGLLGLPSLALP